MNIYTVPEVAQLLKMSKTKVYELVKRREIRHVMIGRNVRIYEQDLQEFLKRHVIDAV